MPVPSEASCDWTASGLANAAGVSIRTLRHYDQLGLLRPSRRSPSGHRRYGASEVTRLYQILSLRALGFSLSTVASLLDEDSSSNLLLLAQDQLKHVTSQLDRYQDLRRQLTRLVEALAHVDAPSTDQFLGILEVINMTVRLSRIYTRTGDSGETHLGDRSRVRKTHPRIEACGDIDELSTHIGVAIATGDLPDDYVAWLHRIQNDLYDVGADLAVPLNDSQHKTRLRVHPEYVRWLEQVCDEVNSALKALNSFVLPGGNRGAAQLHVCRTVCRRAERHILCVDDANPEVVRYLNRLSDLLFILARAANKGSDPLWQPGRHTALAG
jgi:cob(I)alamin adenosyltransferase